WTIMIMEESRMRKFNTKLPSLAVAMVALMVAVAMPMGAWAAADDTGTITLGAVVSLTGDYSTNGKLTRDGYNIAVERINDDGGIQVGDTTYKLKIKYYDDESTSARGAQLAERIIKQDRKS